MDTKMKNIIPFNLFEMAKHDVEDYFLDMKKFASFLKEAEKNVETKYSINIYFEWGAKTMDDIINDPSIIIDTVPGVLDESVYFCSFYFSDKHRNKPNLYLRSHNLYFNRSEFFLAESNTKHTFKKEKIIKYSFKFLKSPENFLDKIIEDIIELNKVT